MSSGRAPLRLADWRFLLPRPPAGQFQHLILIGGSVGLAERIMEVGLARDVSNTIPKERSADALIVLHDAATVLPRIGRCLAPGGVLYYEVDRRSRGFMGSAPNRIRRSIREAGLSPSGTYAVVPNFGEARAYLPVDVPGAVRWYLATLYDAGTPWQHLLKAGLGAATRLGGRRLAPLTAHFAVIAVAGHSRATAPSVLEDPALPPELQGGELRPLLLTYGGDRVVMLPFTPHSTQPAAVLKIPRLPSFNGRTENEHATLRDLRFRLDAAVGRSVPRPLGSVRYGQVTVSIESYAPGELLSRSSEKWGVSRQDRLNDLGLAATWLGEFHRQAEVSRPAWGSAELSQWIDRPFDAFERIFGVTREEARLLAGARQYAASLTGTALPIVIQHRDFTVWNMVRNGRDLTVLDWEGSRPGPALCDLLHFVTHWYEAVDRAHDELARQRRFRALFFGHHLRDPFSAAVHRAIAAYMERLSMHRRFLPLLLVYTWVELALRRADQQQLQDEAGPTPRDGNRYLAFLSILAEHQQNLFGDDAPWQGSPGTDLTAAPPTLSQP